MARLGVSSNGETPLHMLHHASTDEDLLGISKMSASMERIESRVDKLVIMLNSVLGLPKQADRILELLDRMDERLDVSENMREQGTDDFRCHERRSISDDEAKTATKSLEDLARQLHEGIFGGGRAPLIGGAGPGDGTSTAKSGHHTRFQAQSVAASRRTSMHGIGSQFPSRMQSRMASRRTSFSDVLPHSHVHSVCATPVGLPVPPASGAPREPVLPPSVPREGEPVMPQGGMNVGVLSFNVPGGLREIDDDEDGCTPLAQSASLLSAHALYDSAGGDQEETYESSARDSEDAQNEPGPASPTAEDAGTVEEALNAKQVSGLRKSTTRGFRLSITPANANANALDIGIPDAVNLLNNIQAGDCREMIPLYIIFPSSTLRFLIDALNVVFAIYVATATPLLLTYFAHSKMAVWDSFIWFHIADACWLLGMVLNCLTATFQSDAWVTDVRGITKLYLKNGFVLDMVTATPVACAPREGVAFFILFLLKLLRIWRLETLLSKLQSTFRQSFLAILTFKVAVTALLLCHMSACGWRMVQRSSSIPSGMDWTEVYVMDLYWLSMTISSVGYGDIVPTDIPSRLYAIVAMLTAPAFFGASISVIGQLAKQFFDDEVEIKVAKIKGFMQLRHVPLALQRRVERNLRHQMSEMHKTLGPELLTNLSPALQRELSTELLRECFMRFPLFMDASRAFVSEIARAHKWVQALPWDLVVERGQLVQELVFLIQGRLVMRYPERVQEFDGPAPLRGCSVKSVDTMGSYGMPNMGTSMDMEDMDEDDIEETELLPGAWFGESCLFEPDRIRTATGMATMVSELAMLTAVEYHRIITNYPQVSAVHNCILKAVKRGDLNLVGLAYSPPDASTPDAGLRRSMVRRLLRTG
eukprot:TRINITY_DN15214_c0_g1_i2.p1 TRINITY_DN15214_c0_g1~~TRINITY_DN15214_c0_g1_i2.p1  ORF type:complete len:875 (+),score=132.49 TRINITY_DN15214_c0_g1_i2:82-2706(+)